MKTKEFKESLPTIELMVCGSDIFEDKQLEEIRKFAIKTIKKSLPKSKWKYLANALEAEYQLSLRD